jgi:hypothetical protein
MQLTQQFLKELIKLSSISKTVVELLVSNLKFSYLPDENYKKIFKEIFAYYEINKSTPTIGVIMQNINETEVTHILGECVKMHVANKKSSLLKSLQEYIKKSRFVELHTKVAEMYNQNKHTEAISLLSKESKKINEFSLVAADYVKIFEGYQDRSLDRMLKKVEHKFIPTYIPQFDYYSKGGLERGRGFLAVGRSGTGKSFLLRQLGYSAAFAGFDVVHFQAEGTKDEVTEYYDSMWSQFPVHKIKMNDFDHADEELIEKRRKEYADGSAGEIYVVAYEQFDKASIADCRNAIIEILKKSGNLGMAIFDYLEKFLPGDRLRYGATDDQVRSRKLATAEKIVNVATEFNLVSATATQANDIPKNEWNDPQFVITRSNIANLRATIDAFSYCITLNQTEDEADDEIIRIHEEKQRSYLTKAYERTYKIKQDKNNGMFIDKFETNNLFWDKELCKQKKQ